MGFNGGAALEAILTRNRGKGEKLENRKAVSPATNRHPYGPMVDEEAATRGCWNQTLATPESLQRIASTAAKNHAKIMS